MARPRKFDEQQVVAAARDRFWDTGYAGTSLDDLTAATGLGRGSLYGTFGDKRALFLRAFDAYCTESVTGFRTALTGPGSALERLEALIRTSAQAAGGDRRSCLLAKGTAELAAGDDEVASRARTTFVGLHEAIALCVREAQVEGDLDTQANPDQVAGVVLAVLRGLEAIGTSGVDTMLLDGIADGAISMLPRPSRPSPTGESARAQRS